MSSILTINGIAIDNDAIEREAMLFDGVEAPKDAARCALAARELLLQRARDAGFTAVGNGREAEDSLIERLLDAEVATPVPTDAECRRFYDSRPDQYMVGERVEASHILIAVTPGAPLARLRTRAESLLKELRANAALFAERARELSNCPSGQQGGALGQFERGEMVPEFDKAVFGTTATGVLPTLVHTRYGSHIVLIERRFPGRRLAFDQVRERIAASLSGQVQARALAQYVRVLAAGADVTGVDLDAATSPLLQ